MVSGRGGCGGSDGGRVDGSDGGRSDVCCCCCISRVSPSAADETLVGDVGGVPGNADDCLALDAASLRADGVEARETVMAATWAGGMDDKAVHSPSPSRVARPIAPIGVTGRPVR